MNAQTFIYNYLVKTGMYHRLFRTSVQRYAFNKRREVMFIQVDQNERDANKIIRTLTWKYMNHDDLLKQFSMSGTAIDTALNGYTPELSYCIVILCGNNLSYRFFTPF